MKQYAYICYKRETLFPECYNKHKLTYGQKEDKDEHTKTQRLYNTKHYTIVLGYQPNNKKKLSKTGSPWNVHLPNEQMGAVVYEELYININGKIYIV